MEDSETPVSDLLARVNHLELLARIADHARARQREFVMLLGQSRTTTRNLRRRVA